MPFENHGSRAFTETSILKNAPAASGVYGLSNAREWIFVGESDNLQNRLLAHLRGADPAWVHAPTGFTYELSRPADRLGRQNRLVQELAPVQNRPVDAMPGAPE
jgi:excinuclease UvrABC nuclease subunit